MKYISLTIVFVIFSQILFSQEPEVKKGIFGFSAGFAFPTGKFADEKDRVDNSGFALTGQHYALKFDYLLSDNFGIVGTYGRSICPINEHDLMTEIYALNPLASWEFDEGEFTSSSFLVGFNIQGIDRGFGFDMRLMLGLAYASLPRITAEGTGYDVPAYLTMRTSGSSSFAYDIGLGLKFYIGKQIAIITDVDYLGYKPTYGLSTTSNFGFQSQSTYSEKVNLITWTAGIGVRFE
ncbi:MAG: hypothetical protein KDC05_12520 [Bacteroidales bacterium]|nr:hypothetical protein [Bacteroidales bacterium]